MEEFGIFYGVEKCESAKHSKRVWYTLETVKESETL